MFNDISVPYRMETSMAHIPLILKALDSTGKYNFDGQKR